MRQMIVVSLLAAAAAGFIWAVHAAEAKDQNEDKKELRK
jgi:hypothetical protein